MFLSHSRQLAAAGTAAVILALISACTTTNPSQPTSPVGTSSGTPSAPAQQPRAKGFPNGRSDSAEPFLRQLQLEIAADPDFGRTPAKPVTTGPRETSVHRLYLNSLRGPNGEPTSYERRRACCDFKDPSLPMGGGLLDEYEIRVDGSNEVIVLYVDMYRRPTPFNALIPRGFTQRNLQEARAPEPTAQAKNTDAVSEVLEQLRKAVGSQEYAQIKEAIEASATLSNSLKRLYEQKAFIEFVVLTRNEASRLQFGGFERKGRIYLTQEFLHALTQYRPHSPAFADDIKPNNTTFAIAHLLHHIARPIDISKFPNPMAYSHANLAIEAECFLVAWNAMIDAAEKANDGKPLTNQQAGRLLMSSRYIFPFIGKSMSGESLKRLSDGRFSIDSTNIRIVADVLANSKIPDLK